MIRKLILAVFTAILLIACEQIDHSEETLPGENEYIASVALEDVAEILSSIPIGTEHVSEVYDAVLASSSNGYDEEYTLKDLFASPGRGVGGVTPTKADQKKTYSKPLRELIEEHLRSGVTRSSGDGGFNIAEDKIEEYLACLQSSDIQIYWPFSDKWDGKSYPVITFDPDDGSEVNIGYELSDSCGTRVVREVLVDEKTAEQMPVWVVNRNDDSSYTSLEMLRRQDPDWGVSGGNITVRPRTRAGGVKTLILKDFTASRNYDTWFAGASEFFVKCGSIENFTASTEAELRLYSPTITDFMIVVRRNEVGKKKNFNAVLVSEWTQQLENCAFMIIEDDGGSKTSWKLESTVKIKSKSYGIDISIPINSRDDIVWRGMLSAKYLEKYSGKKGSFGDVALTFELVGD